MDDLFLNIAVISLGVSLLFHYISHWLGGHK